MSDAGSGVSVGSGGESPAASAAIAADPVDRTTGKGLIRAKGNGAKPQAGVPSKSAITPQSLPGMGGPTGAENATETEVNPIEAVLLQAIGDEPAAAKPDPEEDVLEGLDPESGAAKRIQKLVADRKAVEAKAKQDHDLAWQYYQRTQQMERQFGQFASQLQRQNAVLQARLNSIQQNMQQAQRQNLSPEQELQEQWLAKQRQLIRQELTPYQKEIQRLRQAAVERERMQRLDSVKSRHSAEMDAALKNILLSTLPEGHLSESDVADAKRWAYAIAMDAAAKGQRLSLKDSVLRMRRVAAKLALGMTRHAQKPTVQAKQNASEAATVVRGANGAARGNADPDIRTLRFNGFRDLPEWKMGGRKPLKTPPADYDW